MFFFRLCSILFFDGYLPFDKSGDWFYQVVEVVALVLTGVMIALVAFVYEHTCVVAHHRCLPRLSLLVILTVRRTRRYEASHDRFGVSGGPIPEKFGAAYIIGPALVLAMVRMLLSLRCSRSAAVAHGSCPARRSCTPASTTFG